MSADPFYIQIAIWSQVASAVLFVAALAYIWTRYLQPMVLTAQERSNEQIAQAERHRDEAKAALELLKGEIESAKHDAELIRERARTHAEREREATIAEVKEAGERTVRNAEGELARAREAARVRLRGELVGNALAHARDAAARRVDGAKNERLVEGFLTALESAPR
jgi:F0F1-type ATP synthase membrane subunit b/b'